MSPIRSLARPMLAAMYVVDGASALRSPGGRVDAVRAAGLSEPEKLVQVNAATMLVGGLLIAANDTGGRESLPHAAGRLSSRAAKKASKAAKKAEKRLHS